MESVQPARDDVRSDSEASDEETQVRCESCGSSISEGYVFYMLESYGRGDGEAVECPFCDSDCGKGKQSQKGKKSASHRLRWADECNKELARQNPRKRYTKKPIRCQPLKPILKTN